MKPKHEPCRCGCGELSDECMTGRNPLGAFTITNERDHSDWWRYLAAAEPTNRRECTPKTEVRGDDPQQRTHTFCTVHGGIWPCRQRPAGDTKAAAAYHPEEES